VVGPSGPHTARLWRVAENVRAHAEMQSDDDRLLHLISRIGILCRGLAADVRAGQVSPDDAATLLDQLADLGDFSLKQWLGSDDLSSIS
jgi:hypothetical protein